MLERIVSLLEAILTELRAQNHNPEGLHAPAPAPAAVTVEPTPVPAPPQTDFMAVAQAAVAPTPNQTATAIITREAVGNALIELATASRDEAVKVLAGFGAQKLGQVKESDYPTLLETIKKATAALKVA